MVEGTTTFSNLVEEAFIAPLRSVLIIDDQYPTWEEILNGASNTSNKDWRNSPAGALAVIKQFRDRNPGFVIDIHDAVPASATSTLAASETPVKLADHLHQSDLLVLDYNLEGESLGGDRARSILQSVLANKHFNLIVVHTGEPDIETVFYDCLLSSMESCTSRFDSNLVSQLENLDLKLDELEADDEFERNKLSEYFGLSEYIELRRPDIPQRNVIANYMKSEGALSSLSSWAKSVGLRGGDLKTFLYWAIREFEKPKSTEFLQQQLEGLKWYNSEECKWFRTVRGFVVFVRKGRDDLLGKLQEALESWKPTPSRLLSAKYRHELNRIGVEAEDRTLLKSHVFAHFYKDICHPSSEDPADGRHRIAKLKEHVSRQSEAISFHIEDEIVKFGEMVVETDVNTGSAFSSFYGIDLSDPIVKNKAVAHYNSYVSTLPLKQTDDQLDSGHILEINGDWWVCATPACDLQPKQTTIAFMGRSDHLRPFTALRLNKVDTQDLSAEQINSGEYCFIEVKPGEIVALGLRVLKKESEEATNDKVTWRTFLAKKSGLIENNSIELIMPKLEAENLINEIADASVIAKLRYEYALNYIQKVGASVSRIGLGYASIREDDEPTGK